MSSNVKHYPTVFDLLTEIGYLITCKHELAALKENVGDVLWGPAGRAKELPQDVSERLCRGYAYAERVLEGPGQKV